MAKNGWSRTPKGREYHKNYMRMVRAKNPQYGRTPWRELEHAFKELGKRPNYLLTKHPLAICPDAFPGFKDAVDPSPDPFEAMCRAEEAAA